MTKRSTGLQASQPAADEKQEFSLISNATLLHLYRNLVTCRILEERAAKPQRRLPSSLKGWEAATVGVAMDLLPEDMVCHDGTDLLLPMLRGQSGDGEQCRVSEASTIATLERALGAALRHKAAKSGKISVAFWRNGSLDCWLDALEAAKAHTLPMIFVCHTQLLHGHAAQESQGLRKNGGSKTRKVELPHMVVDGADVVAVYRVAHEAIERARRDRGPTLIECTRFAVNGERGRADSVTNMETYLRNKSLLARGAQRAIAAECLQALNGHTGRPRSPRIT